MVRSVLLSSTPKYLPSLGTAPTPHRESDSSSESESKKLIEDFLKMGVTTEYLIGYGVSKELIARCLLQLNYPIPDDLAYLVPRPSNAGAQAPAAGPELHQTQPAFTPSGHRPSHPLEAQLTNNHRTASTANKPDYRSSDTVPDPAPVASSSAVPMDQAENTPKTQAPSEGYLNTLREAIRARKRQIKTAGQVQPESSPNLAEQDIEGLFASARAETPSASTPNAESTYFPLDPPPPPVSQASTPSFQEVRSSRTFAPSAPPALLSRHPSTSAVPTVPGRRPKATDFESEPGAPSAAFVPCDRPLFIPDPTHPVRVVIEFEAEDYGSDVEEAQPTSTASTMSRQPSPIGGTKAIPQRATTIDTLTASKLAEKEREIKALQEIIDRRKRERQKSKVANSSRSSSSKPTTKASSNPPTDVSEPETPTVQEPALQEAREAVARLQGEREALVADNLAAENISQDQGEIYPGQPLIIGSESTPKSTVPDVSTDSEPDSSEGSPSLSHPLSTVLQIIGQCRGESSRDIK